MNIKRKDQPHRDTTQDQITKARNGIVIKEPIVTQRALTPEEVPGKGKGKIDERVTTRILQRNTNQTNNTRRGETCKTKATTDDKGDKIQHSC